MAIYEPIYPNDAWPEQFTFSPAVRVGNFVFLSGTTATDDQGHIVGPGDIVLQTRPPSNRALSRRCKQPQSTINAAIAPRQVENTPESTPAKNTQPFASGSKGTLTSTGRSNICTRTASAGARKGAQRPKSRVLPRSRHEGNERPAQRHGLAAGGCAGR